MKYYNNYLQLALKCRVSCTDIPIVTLPIPISGVVYLFCCFVMKIEAP